MSEISDIYEQIKDMSEQIKKVYEQTETVQDTLKIIKKINLRKSNKEIAGKITLGEDVMGMLDSIIEIMDKTLESLTNMNIKTSRMLNSLDIDLEQLKSKNQEKELDELVELGTSEEEMLDLLFEGDYNQLFNKILASVNNINRNTIIIERKIDGILAIDLEQLKHRTQERTHDEAVERGTSENSIQKSEGTRQEDESYYDRTQPHEWDVIWNILRNKIVDYKANEMFGENCNFCEIGAYSDMPGEEQIATTLNLMSIETLKEYFKEYPEDIALFEQMRSKYPNIQSLDEREAEERSDGDEFVANIVECATKKVEVREKNAQAAKLAQDYEQQLPANQQSFGDK